MHRFWCWVNGILPAKSTKTKQTKNRKRNQKMKVNKWTIGLAAAGVVSLASVARADDKPTLSPLNTAVSSTILSGYVDTSMQWNIGPDRANLGPAAAYSGGAFGKADGFNLNVVKISLEKPLDDNGWAAGYKVDLVYGPDAAALGTGFGSNIKQAYVALRTPVGNGIDWKIGVFDTIIGYEVFDASSNPNFTRSAGYGIEPTTHTGVLGTYKIVDNVSVTAGIANTMGPVINARSGRVDANGLVQTSHKTYMAALSLTAPESMGFLKGSTFYAGVIDGFGGSATYNTVNYYAGITLATPVAGLTVGASADYVNGVIFPAGGVPPTSNEATALALYASFKMDKWSFHGRAEYFQGGDVAAFRVGPNASGYAFTATIQYDLWANVLTRLELRWDRARHDADVFGSTVALPAGGVSDNAYTVIANVVYKF
ncbi:MAG: outer membrane beta-barrel protein [Verrucomicrobia bacterium]|nr:outer membrane beta-barrel protein [Verrucomicrobiota bacterium]